MTRCFAPRPPERFSDNFKFGALFQTASSPRRQLLVLHPDRDVAILPQPAHMSLFIIMGRVAFEPSTHDFFAPHRRHGCGCDAGRGNQRVHGWMMTAAAAGKKVLQGAFSSSGGGAGGDSTSTGSWSVQSEQQSTGGGTLGAGIFQGHLGPVLTTACVQPRGPDIAWPRRTFFCWVGALNLEIERQSKIARRRLVGLLIASKSSSFCAGNLLPHNVSWPFPRSSRDGVDRITRGGTISPTVVMVLCPVLSPAW